MVLRKKRRTVKRTSRRTSRRTARRTAKGRPVSSRARRTARRGGTSTARRRGSVLRGLRSLGAPVATALRHPIAVLHAAAPRRKAGLDRALASLVPWQTVQSCPGAMAVESCEINGLIDEGGCKQYKARGKDGNFYRCRTVGRGKDRRCRERGMGGRRVRCWGA